MTYVTGIYIVVIMDEDDVLAISHYLLHGKYPEGFSRDEKRRLRQKSSSFVCETGWYNFSSFKNPKFCTIVNLK